MSTILNFLTGHKDSLESQVERLRVLNRQISQLKLEEAKLKSAIIEQMDGEEEVVNKDGHVIATYKKHSKLSFNQKAFEADFPDQYEIYTVVTTYRTFLLK